MSRMRFITGLVIIASVVTFTVPSTAQDRLIPQWLVGVWRSYKLDYGDFGEWKGAKQIELVVKSRDADDVGLFLVDAKGKRSRAGDSQPFWIQDKVMYFGPIGSSLQFKWRRPSPKKLILDLKTNKGRIHVELRKLTKKKK